MKKIYPYFFSLFLIPTLSAQVVFDRRYFDAGVEVGYDIKPTFDHGYIITGYANPTKTLFGQDLTFLKLDSIGDVEWVTNIGDLSVDMGFAVIETFDSGYVATGRSGSFETASDDLFIVKIDQFGTVLWEQKYGDTLDDIANDIIENPSDSGFVIVGIKENWPYMMRTNKNGDSLWTKTFTDTGVFNSINLLTDGNYLVTGSRLARIDGIYSRKGFALKIDPLGEVIWSKNFYGGGAEEFFDGIELETGKIVLAGYSLADSEPPFEDGILRMLNIDGELIWYETFGGPRSDIFRAVCNSDTDGVVSIGTKAKRYGGSNHNLFYILKVDFFGNIIWEKEIGEDYPHTQQAHSICQAPDGGYVAVGQKSDDELSLYVVKFDELGNPLFIKEIESNMDFNVYPNPMRESARISFTQPINEDVTLNILSLSGQLVDQMPMSKGNTSITIHNKNWPAGLYLIQINFNEKILTRKLIIN